jgi:hypothetical protein
MVTSHPVFEHPEDLDIKIWRYINDEKLASLLRTKALYFARADKLGDPFEGSRPKRDTKILALSGKDSDDLENGRVSINELKDKLIEENLVIEQSKRKILEEYRKNNLKSTFINCWHMNYYESDVMWKLYGNHVCIQSTFRRLKGVLPPSVISNNSKSNVYLGKVKYIDYNNDSTYNGNLEHDTNEYRFFVHKRKSYEHEKELRGIIISSQMFDGCFLPIDINQLIEKIYIKPSASEDFCYKIQAIIDKSNLNLELVKSDLDKVPLY